MKIGIITTRFSKEDLHGDGEIVKGIYYHLSASVKIDIITSDIINTEPYVKILPLKARSVNGYSNNIDIKRIKTYPLIELAFFPLSRGMRFSDRLGINLYKYPTLDILRLIYDGFFAPRLFNCIVKEKYDIIHAHTFPRFSSFIAMKAAKKDHIPFIFSPYYHFANRSFEHSSALDIMLHEASFVVAQTNLEREKLIQKGANPRKTVVIPPSFDKEKSEFKKFSKDRMKEFFNLMGKFVILTHPWTSKGGTVVLRMASEILRDFPDIEILTIGVPDKDFLKTQEILKEQSGLSVVNLGWVSSEVKWKAFWSADVFAMFSFNDSFGLSYLNAMAAELPIIADKNSSAASIINNYEDGILVDTKNNEEILLALKSLINNEELRLRIGKSASVRVDESFSPKTMAELYLNLYERANRKKI
jgi:glycosyltransferase involved in cell wall biosynthesis